MDDDEAAVGGRGRLLALTLLAAAVLFLRAARRAAMLALRAKALALLSTGPAGFAGAALVVVADDGVVADGSAAPHRRFRLRSLALPSFGAVGLDDAVDGASDEDAMAAIVVACFFLFSNQ